ncbi:hypothetical protein [Nocardioides aquiterrae]|uniref:Uncharacterized protein n=1 Tax=Nocardioides aquiterrae TaxID=203799 RepID=A0ABP4F527_9ACTN
MARFSRRTLAAAVALLSLVTPVALMAAGPTTATAAPARHSVSDDAITYTPQTVLVPAAVVKQQLMKVSADGATYTFRKRAGVLAKLKKGSVMLLERQAARDVIATKVVKKHLVVRTTAAALTDLVSDGTLSWDSTLDWSHAFAISGSGVPVARTPARRGGGFTLSGKVEGYGYSAKFTPSDTGMAVSISITRDTPVELEVSITGTLSNLRTAGSITLAHGAVGEAQWLANDIAGSFELAYSAKPISQFGLGQAGGIKVTLPAEVAVPFLVGSIPFYVGVKVAFFASAGFSSFDQSLSGSYTLDYDGHGGFHLTNDGATTAQGVLDGLGQILLNAADAVANGPISFIFGAQLPQLELGMGTKGLSIAGNVTLIGQTGIATYGSGCDTRKFQVLGTTGAKASFFGMSASLGSATLFDKSYYASYPAGCGTFPSRRTPPAGPAVRSAQ